LTDDDSSTTSSLVNPLHAVVRNGRLTLDTPSELPEGQVVVLLPLEELMSMVEDDGDVDEDGDGSREITLSFAPSYPQREFKKPKAVTAKSLLDEIKSL
jgi:hypothetical protein